MLVRTFDKPMGRAVDAHRLTLGGAGPELVQAAEVRRRLRVDADEQDHRAGPAPPLGGPLADVPAGQRPHLLAAVGQDPPLVVEAEVRRRPPRRRRRGGLDPGQPRLDPADAHVGSPSPVWSSASGGAPPCPPRRGWTASIATSALPQRAGRRLGPAVFLARGHAEQRGGRAGEAAPAVLPGLAHQTLRPRLRPHGAPPPSSSAFSWRRSRVSSPAPFALDPRRAP